MAVAKRISKSKQAGAEKFAAGSANHHNGNEPQELEFERLTLRFEKNLLRRIDAAAKADAAVRAVPVNRNGFIAAMMLECVKEFEKEN